MAPNFEKILEKHIVNCRNSNTIFNGNSWIEYNTALDKLKEVWNAAIEEAAENAKAYDPIHAWNIPPVDEESILKLKIK